MLLFDSVLAGSGDFLIIVIFLLVCIYGICTQHIGIITKSAICALLAWGIGDIIKNLFFIPRPFITANILPLIPPLFDGSFPSNHTAMAFGFSLPVLWVNRKLGISLCLISLLVALSRIVAGVHTPTDILGGFSLAFIISLFIGVDSCHSK